jgi:hypothetical protein
VVKTGRSKVKPVSPSSELGASSGPEEDVGGREREDEADAECLYCAGLFSKDDDGEEWVRWQKRLVGIHCFCGLSETSLRVRQVQEVTEHLFIVAAGSYETLHIVILI